MAHSDERIIEALIACPTVTQAAEMAGVHRSTIHRRMNDEAFRAKLDAAKLYRLRAFLATRGAAVECASDYLIDVLENSRNDANRIRAAEVLLRRFW